MIILASTSATRQAMLRNAAIQFSVESPRVDERQVAADNPGWTPKDAALGLAAAKAREVSFRRPEALVIGADQILTLGSRIYSKPADREACRTQLLELRGQTHNLISSGVCARNGEIVWTHTDTARLRMRNFSDSFLEDYLTILGSDVTTSVGGYKIEGLGVQLFETVEGDHFTILGLTLLPLLSYLRSAREIET